MPGSKKPKQVCVLNISHAPLSLAHVCTVERKVHHEEMVEYRREDNSSLAMFLGSLQSGVQGNRKELRDMRTFQHMIASNCSVPKMRALPPTDPRYSSASDDEFVYDDYSGNFSGEENSPLPTNMVMLFTCSCITDLPLFCSFRFR